MSFSCHPFLENGISAERAKQQIYSEDNVASPFDSGLTWQAGAWQGEKKILPWAACLAWWIPTCLHCKGGEEGEWPTWPFPMIKILIWWSQRNKLNCLFQPSIFSRNKAAPATWRQFLQRLGESSTIAQIYLVSSLENNLLHLSGLLHYAKVLQVENRAGDDKRECVPGSVFLWQSLFQ